MSNLYIEGALEQLETVGMLQKPHKRVSTEIYYLGTFGMELLD